MKYRFSFICGDIGGAELQYPVISRLLSLGHSVSICADPDGLANTVFARHGIPTSADPLGDADCFVIGTCATAYQRETVALAGQYGKRPIVLTSDGFFNHLLPPWRTVQANYWCAINDDHAAELRARHPGFRGVVVVTGQPAFDGLPRLFRERCAIRRVHRAALSLITHDCVMVWWSQGVVSVLEEDVSMVQAALESFGSACSSLGWFPAFIPMIHPKIDLIRPGYVADVLERVSRSAHVARVRAISPGSIPLDEICLAADLVCSVTSTQDIKSSLAGGPPVIHFIGPAVREWLGSDLGREPPYFPDIASGLSFGVESPDAMDRIIRRAIADDGFKGTRDLMLVPPVIDDAADRIVTLLLLVVAA